MYFCLKVSAYHLRFQVPYKPTPFEDALGCLEKLFTMVSKDLVSVADEQVVKIVFGIYQRNGKFLTFSISSLGKETMRPYIIQHTKT